MPTSRVVRGMSNHVTSRCSASGLCRFTPKDGEESEVPLGGKDDDAHIGGHEDLGSRKKHQQGKRMMFDAAHMIQSHTKPKCK